MSRKISVDLFSETSIDNAIKELDKYTAEITRKNEEALAEILDTGVEVAQANVMAYVVGGEGTDGELMRSIESELIDDTHGRLYTTAKYAAYVEFGFGAPGADNPSPLHDKDETGWQGWTSQKNKWVYFNPKLPGKDSQKFRTSYGQEPKPFFAVTALQLRDMLPIIFKGVFGK